MNDSSAWNAGLNQRVGLVSSFCISSHSYFLQCLTHPPHPELLRSLGRLARGLSALFWGLPAWIIVSVETTKVDLLKLPGIIPALVLNALLLFGLWQMTDFQKQERPWRAALDGAKILALVNLGLAPFLYFFSRMPDMFYFQAAVFVLVLSALAFLFNLNVVLRQLGAMLPDETLRHETRQFTTINCWLLVGWVIAAAVCQVLPDCVERAFQTGPAVYLLVRPPADDSPAFLGLAPVAVTMALLWKAKEVILGAVFGARD